MIEEPQHPLPDSLFAELGLDREDALAVINKVVSQKDELISIAKGLAG